MRDIDFDTTFPSTSKAFDTGYVTGIQWRAAKERGLGEFLWQAEILSVDLIRYVASWREGHDAFLSRRIYSKLYLLAEDLAIMATRKRKDAIRDDSKAAWKGFLDRRMTEGELDELDAWKPKPLDIFSTVDAMIQDGYRLTLSYNKQTKLASVTIIDDNNSRTSGGYALSNADTDGALALKMAVYKHTVLLNSNWEGLLDQPVKSRRG